MSIETIIQKRKEWLKEIDEQDNRATQRPIIIALQVAHQYPARDGYGSDGEWPANEDHGNKEPVPYKTHWEDEMQFFTYSAVQEHLMQNKHNYKETRDFVKHAYRNREWKEIPEDFRKMINYIEELERKLNASANPH